MQFDNPRNYHLVKEALLRENRLDLIGYGTGCLIAPRVNDYSLRKQLESYQRQQKPTVKEARGKGTGGKEYRNKNRSKISEVRCNCVRKFGFCQHPKSE